jgi:hypothetical protein
MECGNLKHRVFKQTNAYTFLIKSLNKDVQNRMFRQLIFLYNSSIYENIDDITSDFFFLLKLGLDYNPKDNVQILMNLIYTYNMKKQALHLSVENYLQPFIDDLSNREVTDNELKFLYNKIISQLYTYFLF